MGWLNTGRDGEKIVEIYSTKTGPFRKYSIVPEGYHDFLGALQNRLGDACEFGGPTIPIRGALGLEPDRIWDSVVKLGSDKIDIQVRQSYRKADIEVTGAKARIKYLPGTSEENLKVVRESLILSGLERTKCLTL